MRLPVWVRPGSAEDSIAWDPWRRAWTVRCRAPAVGGAANRAVLALVAERLSIAPSSVRWERAGTSRSKLIAVLGLTDEEVRERLSARADRRPVRAARGP